MGEPAAVTSSAEFQRAFVAISYFLDRRGEELLEPLEAPGAQAQELARRLAHAAREQRAQALAGELSRVIAGLELVRAF
jgi:hypothetical protein